MASVVLILRMLKTFHCRARDPRAAPSPHPSHHGQEIKITNYSFGLRWAQGPGRAAPCRGKIELCIPQGAHGGAAKPGLSPGYASSPELMLRKGNSRGSL